MLVKRYGTKYAFQECVTSLQNYFPLLILQFFSGGVMLIYVTEILNRFQEESSL